MKGRSHIYCVHENNALEGFIWGCLDLVLIAKTPVWPLYENKIALQKTSFLKAVCAQN
jgi:hypothetical protein